MRKNRRDPRQNYDRVLEELKLIFETNVFSFVEIEERSGLEKTTTVFMNAQIARLVEEYSSSD